jgi:hypothetical protein
MKQKLLLNLILYKKIFAWALISLFVLGNFAFVNEAYAACNFKINRFDTGGKTQVGANETLTFYGEIERKEVANNANEIGDCGRSRFTVTITTENLTHSVSGKFVRVVTNGSPTLFVGDKYVFQHAIDLNNYSKDQFQNKTELNFSLDVSSDAARTTSAHTQWKVGLNYSGSVPSPIPSNGSKPIEITTEPVGKQVFYKDEKLTIVARMNSANVRNIPPQVSTVIMETYINGSTKVGSYEISRSWLENNSPKQEINKVTSPPFNNGVNVIKVIFRDKTTNAEVGSGAAQVSAQGLANTIPPNPQNTIPPNPQNTVPPNPSGLPQESSGLKLDCAQTPNAKDCLYNPLPTSELTSMFLLIARGMFAIVAIWSVIFIIVGGFRMVIAAGNEEAIGAAKKTITWAILGLVIAMLSFSIIAIVQNIIQADVKTL